jgi:hypothetical protein
MLNNAAQAGAQAVIQAGIISGIIPGRGAGRGARGGGGRVGGRGTHYDESVAVSSSDTGGGDDNSTHGHTDHGDDHSGSV